MEIQNNPVDQGTPTQTQAPTPTPHIEPLPTPPPSPEEKPVEENKHDTIKSVLSTLGVFLLAPIIAILLTAFVFQSYEVDGPSMETTLQNQDRLIVYKLPKTWANLTGGDYIPDRGDIIIFNRHESGGFEGETDKQLIKRVIGLPGDHVVINGGTVTVYNEKNPNGFDPDENKPYREGFKKTNGNIDISVDEGEVFVLGDNRDNSLDSRVFGAIKTDEISGKLSIRIYPFNKFDAF